MIRLVRLIEQSEEAPTLRELGAAIGLSETHLQRRFTTEVGVSPRRYGLMVREARLRTNLQANGNVSTAIYEAGFRSASPVYGDVRSPLGMSPAEFRSGARGIELLFGVVESELGSVLVAATHRGVARVDIGTDAAELVKRLYAEFPNASITRADDRVESATSLIVRYLAGEGAWPKLPVDILASAFQARVWHALREIAPGKTMSYTQLAEAIGSPKAARAVARVCAMNSVALLIPCHRIVPAAGGVGGYRWDPARKKRLLEIERRGAKTKNRPL